MLTNITPCIVGIDEAGRGPWAGPVVAGAVVFNPNFPEDVSGMRDSKKMSMLRRESALKCIMERHYFGIGWAHPHDIDEHNILQATFLAMQRATWDLRSRFNVAPAEPIILRIDGNRLPQWTSTGEYTAQAIVRGDDTEPCISAASIVAKQVRDAWMNQMHEIFPQYGFNVHKGYGTPQHSAALHKYGPCSIHRRSFSPVRALLNATS